MCFFCGSSELPGGGLGCVCVCVCVQVSAASRCRASGARFSAVGPARNTRSSTIHGLFKIFPLCCITSARRLSGGGMRKRAKYYRGLNNYQYYFVGPKRIPAAGRVCGPSTVVRAVSNTALRRSPAWHRRLRAQRSQTRLKLRQGSRPRAAALRALAGHHGTCPAHRRRLQLLMGRGKAWKSDQYDQYQGPYGQRGGGAGQGRQYWGYWSGSWQLGANAKAKAQASPFQVRSG